MIIDSPKLLFKNSPCEMMHKRNVIYKFENLSNGKVYIGKTTRELRVRIHEHIYNNRNYPIERAVRKYGIEGFDVEVIAEAENEEELNGLEKFFITFYDSKKPNGYNLTDGSEGCQGLVFTEEHRNKIAEKAKKRRHSEQTKQKISEHKKGQGKGIPLRAETIAKMVAANPRKRRVMCIETGQIFESIGAAARSFGVSHECIGCVCRGRNKTAAGYHWSFVDKDGNQINSKFQSRAKKVLCVETGTIFESADKAAEWAGVSSCFIRHVCGGSRDKAGGYCWKYVEEDEDKA